MIPVAGCTPELLVEDQRGLDLLISSLDVLGSPESLQLVADYHALWQEERESRSFFGEHEQIHFLAYLAVVTLFGFFQLGDIFIQHFLCRESGSIYPLEHLPVGVTSPVCSGNAHKLKGFDLSR